MLYILCIGNVEFFNFIGGIIMKSVKSRAFLQGIADFYLGNQKEVSFSRSSDELMSKALKMTGDSMKGVMKEYATCKK